MFCSPSEAKKKGISSWTIMQVLSFKRIIHVFFYKKIFYKKMSLKKPKALRKFIFLYSLLMVVPSFDSVKPNKINN